MGDRIAGVAALVLASLLVSGVALADDKQEAKKRFEKGVALYNNEDYSAALVEFRAAYAALPHFAVKYNIGITLYKLHRYAEAMDEFLSFLAEGGSEIAKDRKAEVTAIIEELDSYVSLATFTCNVPDAKLFLNGTFKAELGEQTVMALDVGEYDMEVRAKGHETHYQHIEVPGGQSMTIAIELKADVTESAPEEPAPVIEEPPALPPEPAPEEPVAPDPRKKYRIAFGTMLGLAVVAGISGGIMGGLSLSKKGSYMDADSESDANRIYRDMQTLALAADIHYGFTAAAGVVAIVMAVLAFRKPSEKQDAPAARVSPWLDAPGLTLTGVF